mgnify:FL=1
MFICAQFTMLLFLIMKLQCKIPAKQSLSLIYDSKFTNVAPGMRLKKASKPFRAFFRYKRFLLFFWNKKRLSVIKAFFFFRGIKVFMA